MSNVLLLFSFFIAITFYMCRYSNISDFSIETKKKEKRILFIENLSLKLTSPFVGTILLFSQNNA